MNLRWLLNRRPVKLPKRLPLKLLPRSDDLFVPDFVKEAEEQIAKGVNPPAQEEVTIKFGKGLAEPFQSKDGREFMRITIPN